MRIRHGRNLADNLSCQIVVMVWWGGINAGHILARFVDRCGATIADR